MIPNRPVRFRRGPVAALLNRVLSWGEPYVGEDEDRIFVGGKGSNIELLNKAEFTKHLDEKTIKLYHATRTVNVTGTQTISLLENKVPKYIRAKMSIVNTKVSSRGIWADGVQHCLHKNNAGLDDLFLDASIIAEDSDANWFMGRVSNVTKNSFDLLWTTSGSGSIAGDLLISFEVGYHGGEE